MRKLILLLVLVSAGCASNRGHVGYCSVLNYAGKIGSPYGLVALEPKLEETLRAQLPPESANGYICWYATGDEILAANRGGGGVSGTVFVRSGSEWVLADEPDRILLLPPFH